MKSVTISMRLPVEEVKELEKLAQELETERPVFLRQALKRGVEDLRFERAAQAYRSGEATLSRAAEIAGLSVHELILKFKDADLYLNYGVDEFEQDLLR